VQRQKRLVSQRAIQQARTTDENEHNRQKAGVEDIVIEPNQSNNNKRSKAIVRALLQHLISPFYTIPAL
jgi:hypothetical protein